MTELRQANLPLQPNPLVGRERELAATQDLLLSPAARLLTLTGPGGCGKTRLAVELANRVAPNFADGVYFVDLSVVRDDELVVSTISEQLLEPRGVGLDRTLDHLTEVLAGRELLLVLDNFEQVIPAAPQISRLLAACARLKVVVTSREALHLRWEHEFPVPTLSGPRLNGAASAGSVAASPAVTLFVQRAQSIRPDWTLTDANARAVAELCLRLDGLPLGIELAAARIGVLSPEAMLGRITRRLELLSDGPRDEPGRQQGLRVAVDWSYNLLSTEERTTFSRAGVFAGGFTLAAGGLLLRASSTPEARVLGLVTALVDKSLLRREFQPDGEPRFSMLETIRDYAQEQLEALGELQVVQKLHANWCLRLAEEARPGLNGPDQLRSLERLEREHDNIRAALHWALHGGDVAIGVRLAIALVKYWEMRGHLHEADLWLTNLLPSRETVTSELRARLCAAAGHVAFLLGDYPRAEALHDESLGLARAAGARREIVECLRNLGLVALARADDERARTLFEEALEITRAIGDRSSEALCLHYLGRIAAHAGRQAAARQLLEDSLALRQAGGDRWASAESMIELSAVLRAQGATDEALRMLMDSLAIWHELKEQWGLAYTLEAFGLHYGAAQAERAVRLIAAASAARERIDIRRLPGREVDVQRTLRACRQQLAPERFEEVWAEGAQLTLDAAADDAVEPGDVAGAPRAARTSRPGGLTEREAEVVTLLAQGQSNRQIADALVISPGTAERHVANVLRKLDLSSRAQIARWAIDNGLGRD